MCSLCGVLLNESWAEQGGGRRARALRVRLLNRVLSHFGLRLDDWSGRTYVLRDRKGRSLYELDLTRRLLKYPCSYLIYSPAFDALPPLASAPIYRRLWEVLSGPAIEPRYRALSLADRQAIAEILIDTKPGLPAYFTEVRK